MGQMYGMKWQPRSQDLAGASSVKTVDSCSDSRVERMIWGSNSKKRKTTTEMVVRFTLGSPEGIRWPDQTFRLSWRNRVFERELVEG